MPLSEAEELELLELEAESQGAEATAFAGGVETAMSIGTGLLAEPVSGLAGIAGSVLPGEPGQGAAWIEGTREAMTYQPRSEKARRYLGNIGEAVNYVDELPRDITGQSFSEGAEDTSKFFQERGAELLSPFGETGKAVGAAAGSILLPAGEMLAGIKGARALPSADGKAPRVDPTLDPVAEKIKEGSGDVETAKVKLDEKGKVVKDKAAVETIRQGFDEGLVAAVKASTPMDRSRMLKMVDAVETGMRNRRYAVLHRPSDVVGDSLGQRVSHIKKRNQQSGKLLDSVAKSLKGKSADYHGPVDNFLESLDDMGVGFEGGKLQFKGSDIEGLKGPQKIISNLVKRMLDTKTPDAYDVHRLKRFIDEQVTYGKFKKGLAGRAEGVVKNLRRELDEALDKKFSEYDSVNTEYADTITALNDFQSAVGKIDLLGPNADKAIGTAARKLLTNYSSRAALLDSIEELNAIAAKYGGQFKDDIIVQAMFVHELDGIFGAAAKGSFKGEIEQGVKTALREGPTAGAKNYAIDKAAEKINDMRGVNKKGAIAALRKLLSEPPSELPRKPGLPAAQQ